MTDDSRKGWRYKLAHDRNARLRRRADVRERVAMFRRDSPPSARYCHSRSSTPHGGRLEVQHVGGIKRDQRRQRLTWFCRKHNREDAGENLHKGHFHRPRARASSTSAAPWIILALAALAFLFVLRA